MKHRALDAYRHQSYSGLGLRRTACHIWATAEEFARPEEAEIPDCPECLELHIAASVAKRLTDPPKLAFHPDAFKMVAESMRGLFDIRGNWPHK